MPLIKKQNIKLMLSFVPEKCVKISDECVFTPNITPTPSAVSAGLNILN